MGVPRADGDAHRDLVGATDARRDDPRERDEPGPTRHLISLRGLRERGRAGAALPPCTRAPVGLAWSCRVARGLLDANEDDGDVVSAAFRVRALDQPMRGALEIAIVV